MPPKNPTAKPRPNKPRKAVPMPGAKVIYINDVCEMGGSIAVATWTVTETKRGRCVLTSPLPAMAGRTAWIDLRKTIHFYLPIVGAWAAVASSPNYTNLFNAHGRGESPAKPAEDEVSLKALRRAPAPEPPLKVGTRVLDIEVYLRNRISTDAWWWVNHIYDERVVWLTQSPTGPPDSLARSANLHSGQLKFDRDLNTWAFFPLPSEPPSQPISYGLLHELGWKTGDNGWLKHEAYNYLEVKLDRSDSPPYKQIVVVRYYGTTYMNEFIKMFPACQPPTT